MNDIEREFYRRNRELKSAGTGAYHQKNGSKSRACPLRQDRMTPAQLRRENGPTVIYQTDAPISYEEFKSYPDDIKAKCLANYIEKYDASDSMIGEMMGVSSSCIAVIRKTLHISCGANRGKRSEKTLRQWQAFCSRAYAEEEEGAEDAPTQPLPVSVAHTKFEYELTNVSCLEELRDYLPLLPFRNGIPATVRIEVIQ